MAEALEGRTLLTAGQSWLEMDGTGTRELMAASPQAPYGPVAQTLCLYPILIVNMVSFEGMWFATEAMLSRLLNLHVPALWRASENREMWKEFERGEEKT